MPDNRLLARSLVHPLIDPENVESFLKRSLAGDSATYAISKTDAPTFLRDHAFKNIPVFPGVAYIDLALALFGTADNQKSFPRLHNIQFESVLLLDSFSQAQLEIQNIPLDDQTSRLAFVTSQDNGTEYAQLIVDWESKQQAPLNKQTLADLRAICSTAVNVSEFYADLNERGNQYGSAFQGVNELYVAERQACAYISLDKKLMTDSDQYACHPTLLDGCIQTLSATHDSAGHTFILSSIGQVDVWAKIDSACWAYATLKSSAEKDVGGIIGDISIFTSDGIPAMLLTDVEFSYLNADSAQENGPERTVAISATFTGEPVAESIDFWSKKLRLNLNTQFAPYNQVFQQLLDPSSIQYQNESGLNVILLRFEDWLVNRDGSEKNTGNRVSTDDTNDNVNGLLKKHDRYRLPNGMEIASLNPYETEYVYKEIFVDNAYLKHDVAINDGDTIIDIGANIGLFTLWVQQQAANTTVHAFEPSPPVFDILQTNAKLHGTNVHVHNFGVSDKKKEAEFTFYAKSSVFSSFSADEEEDRRAIKAVVENMVRDNVGDGIDDIDALVDELMGDRLDSKAFTCQLTSLSDVIAEQKIEQIDLLKLDAEKSELDVLRGIQEEDWPKIKQIVMEVHDKEGPLIEAVTDMLRTKGFELEIEEETYLQNSGLFNIFASRGNITKSATSQTISNHENALDMADETHLFDTLASFTAALQNAAEHSVAPYLVCVCPPSPNFAEKAAPLLTKLIEQLDNALHASTRISLRTYDELLSHYNIDKYYDAATNELGHVPYTDDYFAAVGTQIVRTIDSVTRAPYKVIVLDCDNTLWKGIVGEDGPQGIKITDGHRTLQKFMLKQLELGMVLCLCSKNVELDVFDALEVRDDILLKQTDLVGWRINWQPKPVNLRELALELQLGLDSFIFIDDNPIECAEVRAACPEVITLQLPTEPEKISHFLNHIWAFDKFGATTEDTQRTKMYQENMDREQFRTSAVTLESFLDGLKLDIQIQPLDQASIERVSQLTQRTNQFNFTTIRRSVGDIQKLTQSGELNCLIVHVSDRFGAYGLVGVLLYSERADTLVVDTMLLSCRVLGRGVEHRMLSYLGELAAEKQLDSIEIPFESTKKNQPALDFLEVVASNYSVSTGGPIRYKLPTDIAKTIVYQPYKDAEYAERALARSTEKKPKQNTETALPARSEQMMSIAQEFSSSIQILAQIAVNPQTERPDVATEYVSPLGDTQQKLASIWSDILGVKQVGVNDNFFEMGGTSLKGVQLIAQLKMQLNIDFTIVNLFEYPTITQMTSAVEKRNGANQTSELSAGKQRGENRRAMQRARRRR